MKKRSKVMTLAVRYRRFLRPLVLGVIVANSMSLAFALRFDFAIEDERLPILLQGILLALVIKLPIFHFLKLDRGGWRYLEVSDLKAQFVGNVVASLVFTLAAYFLIGPSFPRSIYGIDFLANFLITTTILLAIRLYKEPGPSSYAPNAKNILIYGAGGAGRTLLGDIQSRPATGYRVVGFLDDDAGKHGLPIGGVPVLGSGRRAASIVNRLRKKGVDIEEIIVAMPMIDSRRMNEALANCRAAQVPCKTVPGLVELLNGKVLGQFHDIDGLLGREPVQLDLKRIRSTTEGQCVLVTGAGGSIGSELCRQVARFDPAKLVLFDQAETDLYRIHREMTESFPRLEVVPVVGTIRSYRRISEVIQQHQVHSIFHAAAYKHVPMMESHAFEAAENNVVGTYNVAEAALACRVRSFVMISSDKAVNPTNIMGLTKRISELLVTSMPKPKMGVGTKFVSVRFGNVLGSNGSVVPLFREQIAAGGPVTVTHPDMERFFMTIPEAVQLVLEASLLGAGGEVFVLEMGEPVKIVELAKNMIRLAGRSPEEIEIRFTGIRPGEKLYEEVQTDNEDMLPTHHKKIKIFAGPVPSRAEMAAWVAQLKRLLEENDRDGIVAHLTSLVPESKLTNSRMAPQRQVTGQAVAAG